MDSSNKKEKLLNEPKDIKFKEKDKDIYSINVNTKIQQYITSQDLLSNKICTSKYNFINALPKIVCEQFSKVGNIYFLFLAILQMIPSISQSGGTPTILMPLIFVVVVNGVKDFCEDYKRKQSDNRENKTKCVLVGNGYESCRIVNWEEIKPGDVVKIYKDEYFPADLVLLYSTNKNGVAYVETKNLDGETNLKYKESVKNSYRLLKQFGSEHERENVIKKTFGIIQCDKPNAHMYEFDGIYYYESRTSVVNFDANEANEKNTSDHGIENNFDRTYSKDGHQDMAQGSQNNSNNAAQISAFKESSSNAYNAERRVSALEDASGFLDKSIGQGNNHIISSSHSSMSPVPLDYNNFLLRGSSLRNTDFIYGVVIYCGHNTKIMLNSLTARTKQSKVFKIMNSQLKLIIILQMIICVSFGLLYSLDPDPYNKILYYKEMTPYDVVRNFIFAFFAWLLAISNIVPISLLVTVEMIKFCQASFISWDFKMYDKENKRTAIVQSSGLNEELGQIQDIFTDKTGTLTKNIMQFRYVVIGDHLYGSEKRIDPEELKLKNVTNVDYNDPTLFDHWNNSSHPNSENINNFIFSLALCHSIIVEKKDDEIIYNASSPDELALVNAAKYLGVEFTERTDDNMIILKFRGNVFRYKLLNIFEFNSDRKRMSVVIKDENNVIKLICKGADSIINKRLNSLKR
jgi:magnesium-transporting ATPase (P-type)